MTYQQKIKIAIEKIHPKTTYYHMDKLGGKDSTGGGAIRYWLSNIKEYPPDAKMYILNTINHLYRTKQI